MITVAIINKSTVLTDANVQAAVPALQVQVSRDFAPVWGIDAQLVFVGQSQQPPPDAWQLIVLDDSDQAGALGYHELKLGVPIGFVFARTDIQNNLNWTVTCSHELLEMLADPFVCYTVFVPGNGRRQPPLLLALEVADAPEADQFAYSIAVPGATAYEVKVSDFVTPAWFGAPLPSGGPGSKYSFMGHCTQPYQILPGGYIGAMPLRGAGAWTQITGQAAPGEHSKWTCHQLQADGSLKEIAPPKGSRRERRARHHKEMIDPKVIDDYVGGGKRMLAEAGLHTALFGPVRNDMDNLIGEAADSLHKMDNVANWIATVISAFAAGKSKVRIGLDKPINNSSDLPTISVWLEPKT